MVFSGKRRLQIDNISINDNAINKVSQCHFLGIILDDKLSWKPHIQLTSRKVSGSIGILRKINRHLSKSIMLQLYKSFILPYLQYGITIWGSAKKRHQMRYSYLRRKQVKLP